MKIFSSSRFLSFPIPRPAVCHTALIALDRKEKKDDAINNEKALAIMQNIPIYSIINYFDIIDFIQRKPDLNSYHDSLIRYHNKYGIN